ncbi:MAG: ATP-grasp domain-containing protein [Acidobacteriota bacterium]|nr:MAG: ATP-grasp domain-containing protein [Acidobacteriota bacterium]
MSRQRLLRVLALVHKELEPPKNPNRYNTNVDWKMEFDVIESLRYTGHYVEVLGLHHDLSVLAKAIERFRPEVLFNLLEDFRGVAVNDQHWVSHLELLGLPYTGCNPRGLLLARDKSIAKKLLAYESIPAPRFAVFRRGERGRIDSLRYPVIVKSLIFDGSVGISQASVVVSERKLRDRVRFVHEDIGTDAIAEEFIDGRELYVGVLGNERLETLPVWELRFRKRPPSTRLIATERVKWSDKYQKKVGVHSGRARLPEAKAREIQALARRIYRALELSGYGRIDFRMTDDGTVYFLEANPNPQLAYGEDFAESAEKAGVSYEDLISRILKLAFSRPRS